jgi:hypothetical protein
MVHKCRVGWCSAARVCISPPILRNQQYRHLKQLEKVLGPAPQVGVNPKSIVRIICKHQQVVANIALNFTVKMCSAWPLNPLLHTLGRSGHPADSLGCGQPEVASPGVNAVLTEAGILVNADFRLVHACMHEMTPLLFPFLSTAASRSTAC